MDFFAVIDTETNWDDEVMSIGMVIADTKTYRAITSKYWIINPEYNRGGMYSRTLEFQNKQQNRYISRKDALLEVKELLFFYNISDLFAYNASFDCRHLPELSDFIWHDIIQIAAYKQHNSKIPKNAECHNTGRMKKGYSVENMFAILSGKIDYEESHNALLDAYDELEIMRLLSHNIENYPKLGEKTPQKVGTDNVIEIKKVEDKEYKKEIEERPKISANHSPSIFRKVVESIFGKKSN
ncbi:hypothetical protein [Lactococcus lactis]|uniref:hypothetical protein n=1 Tax=Lactococcus lactis TaxID=1358 RepID=UPI0022E4DCCF|nr:hypothetical protein [Lactococcus lactis]